MSFNENLRTLRLARGLTQPALAEKAGIEQSYLSKLENGRSKPSEDVLSRLAQALDVKSEALTQNGDEAEERRRRWRHGLAVAGFALSLVVVFLLGRATAVYPLSFWQVIHGARADDNLVLTVRELAPQGVEVITVTGNGDQTRLNVSGNTTGYAALDTYMQAIKHRFGGGFSYITLEPERADKSHHFDVQYNRDGAR
jgi:transcriptional regulator with XRE-family HTH domain